MADRLWDRAEGDLRVQVADRGADLIIWEHSSRVAQLADAITGFSEIAAGSCDKSALTAAALYHDAGWILQLKNGEITRQELLLAPTPDLYRDMAADWALGRLQGIVPAGSLELAAQAIREVGNRQTDLHEAQILAEADNLDQIGPQAISLMLRKQRLEGKTLADMVATWRRQEEYHYWQARIKKGFRFASTRELAERRWHALQRFMNDLQAAIGLEDLSDLQRTSPPTHTAKTRSKTSQDQA